MGGGLSFGVPFFSIFRLEQNLFPIGKKIKIRETILIGASVSTYAAKNTFNFILFLSFYIVMSKMGSAYTPRLYDHLRSTVLHTLLQSKSFLFLFNTFSKF